METHANNGVFSARGELAMHWIQGLHSNIGLPPQKVSSTSVNRKMEQDRIALPISVTTGSRLEIGKSGLPSDSRRQQLLADQTRNSLIASAEQCGQEPRIPVVSGISFPGGGITLPKSIGLQNSLFMPNPKVLSQMDKIASSSSPQGRETRANSDSTVVDNKSRLKHLKNKVYSSVDNINFDVQHRELNYRIHGTSGSMDKKHPLVNIADGKFKYRKVIGGKAIVPRSMSLEEVSPQIFLDNMLKARGYNTQNFCSLEGAYYCKPTDLQKASYGIKLLDAVRKSDFILVKRMLEAGISPNPCNTFGESVIHMLCRRGDFKLLKLFKECGCSFQVTDDFGRTPLHDACWTSEPPFDIIDLILTSDRRLLHIVDCRGSSPLSYVRRENWSKWIEFIQSRAETYWTPRAIISEGDEPPPPLSWKAQHSRPIPDPPNALSIEMAQKLVTLGEEVLDELTSNTLTNLGLLCADA